MDETVKNIVVIYRHDSAHGSAYGEPMEKQPYQAKPVEMCLKATRCTDTRRKKPSNPFFFATPPQKPHLVAFVWTWTWCNSSSQQKKSEEIETERSTVFVAKRMHFQETDMFQVKILKQVNMDFFFFYQK